MAGAKAAHGVDAARPAWMPNGREEDERTGFGGVSGCGGGGRWRGVAVEGAEATGVVGAGGSCAPGARRHGGLYCLEEEEDKEGEGTADRWALRAEREREARVLLGCASGNGPGELGLGRWSEAGREVDSARSRWGDFKSFSDFRKYLKRKTFLENSY